jgi:multimeric flavodoxin WrbA
MRKRPLNVLILLGSPREDGNSTRLAFAFADAASRNGHAVQTIRLSALEFAPCDGCGDCWPTASRPCVIRDDLDSVYPLLRKADVLVFATPLHFYAWSTPLKKLTDRLYCLSPQFKRNLKGKKSVLLAAAADDRPAAFAGLKATYRSWRTTWLETPRECRGGSNPRRRLPRRPRAGAGDARARLG